MAERMRRNPLVYPRPPHRRPHRLRKRLVMDMVPPPYPRYRIHTLPSRRKDPEKRPLQPMRRELPRKLHHRGHPRPLPSPILIPQRPAPLPPLHQRLHQPLRKRRDTALVTLPRKDAHRPPLEIESPPPQPHHLPDPQSRSEHQPRHQRPGLRKLHNNRLRLRLRSPHRNPHRAARIYPFRQLTYLPSQNRIKSITPRQSRKRPLLTGHRTRRHTRQEFRDSIFRRGKFPSLAKIKIPLSESNILIHRPMRPIPTFQPDHKLIYRFLLFHNLGR